MFEKDENSKTSPDLSLILTCYNEATIVRESTSKIIEVLDNSGINYEIVFVDDGSEDDTPELIKNIKDKSSGHKVNHIFHKKNEGRGKSVTDGFLAARGKVVGYIDTDLEVAADYIPFFVETILGQHHDGANAVRRYKFGLSSAHRYLASKGYAWLVKLFLNLPYKDTVSGYKFFLKDKIVPVLEKTRDPHWFWDTEIMARSYLAGLNIKEIPVNFVRRSDKKSTVKFFKDSFDYFIKLLKFSKDFKNEVELEQYWKNNPLPYSDAYETSDTSPMGHFNNLFVNLRKKAIIQMLTGGEFEKILDLGCGSGDFFNIFKNEPSVITGVDYSQAMLTLAEQKHKKEIGHGKIKLLKWDAATKLPFDDGVFDLALAVGLFDYLSEPKSTLDELARTIRSDGTAIVTIPKTFSPFFFLRGRIGSYFRRKSLNLPPIIFWQTQKQAIKLLTGSGLEPTEIKSIMGTMWIFKCRKV